MTSPAASKLAFKKQAEVAREALQAFNLICPLAASAPGPVKTTLSEVVAATVSSRFLIIITETYVSLGCF